MKRLASYLLLSIALHVSAGWLLHGAWAKPEPLAWQVPITIQLISLAQAAQSPPTTPVRPTPLSRDVAPVPVPETPRKPDPVPTAAKPLPVVTKPALAKAPAPERKASKPAQVHSAARTPVPAASPPSATKVPSAPFANLPAATPPTTPVLSLRPSFVSPPPPPRYPSAARRRNLQGSVQVEVYLDERGHQITLKLIRSSGVDSLDQAAVAAVTQWRFRPEIVNGRAVPSRVQIPIEFALTANR